jgi:hypothetical protein
MARGDERRTSATAIRRSLLLVGQGSPSSKGSRMNPCHAAYYTVSSIGNSSGLGIDKSPIAGRSGEQIAYFGMRGHERRVSALSKVVGQQAEEHPSFFTECQGCSSFVVLDLSHTMMVRHGAWGLRFKGEVR